MDLVDRLYEQENVEHNRRAWNKFTFLSPSFSHLRTEHTRRALAEQDQSYLLDALRFVLFPDEGDAEVNENMKLCINKGIRAVNSLTEVHLGEFLDGDTKTILTLDEVQQPFDLFDFVTSAREQWESGTMRVRRVNQVERAKAYAKMRAIELGYRVGTIDASPYVQNSLIYFDQVVDRLRHLLGFTNPQAFNSGWLTGPAIKFDTKAGVAVYSRSEEEPIKSRLKYLKGGCPNYPSILMKHYRDLEYPDEIRDYTGIEITVKDNGAGNELVSYFRRKTAPGGAFEGFKDTTDGQKLSGPSSGGFKVKKFFLRVPARLNHPIEHASGRIVYERSPVEIQILTLDDAKRRDEIPAVSHIEYKRRQYISVFPVLFPRQIYEPLLRL